jgi:hypothetical protein
VLVPGGAIRAIEVDYSTVRVTPSTAAIEGFISAVVRGMDASGHSDAGTHVAGWLEEAGFRSVGPGARACRFAGDDLVRQSAYFADIWDAAIPGLLELPEAQSEEDLRKALAELRQLPANPHARLEWVIHKARGIS